MLISRCFFASSSAIEIDGIPSQGAVEENRGRSHPRAPRIWACPFKTSQPVSQCRFYGGKGLLLARVEVGESVFSGRVHSSKTAPHFGHFSALSSTSAPQFVHVKSVALEAFSLFTGPASATLGFGVSSGICGSAPSIRVRVDRARTVYHHMNRIT